ncbi:hypothetical protein AB0N05_14060 [Nocardia sp. NPDC051030]|uniref:hypothetical protein n=1 Tax=Nocardia sp. NPDC051030 TaxID=3155162 RepID=UPI003426943F
MAAVPMCGATLQALFYGQVIGEQVDQAARDVDALADQVGEVSDPGGGIPVLLAALDHGSHCRNQPDQGPVGCCSRHDPRIVSQGNNISVDHRAGPLPPATPSP